VIFTHQNLISNWLTYLVHAKSTGELISFGFSDRSVRCLVSAISLSEIAETKQITRPNEKNFTLWLIFGLSPNLGLSETLIQMWNDLPVCLKITGLLQLIWHNWIISRRSLIIFGTEIDLLKFSIDYDEKFLNWLRTSCVVSITTVATWRTGTAHFWADFKQHIIGRTVNERQNDCGAVSMPKDSIKTYVVTVDTAEHFIILIETLFVKKIYRFCY